MWTVCILGSPKTVFLKVYLTDKEASACKFIKKGYGPTSKIRERPRSVAGEKDEIIIQNWFHRCLITGEVFGKIFQWAQKAKISLLLFESRCICVRKL